MARTTLPLTNTQIKSAKAKEKDYKLFDGGGLFLLVAKTGGKRWRLKYRFNNKEKTLAIDDYSCDYTTKMALKMLPYVFVRSYNIRHCEWLEIDFENKEWIIPANKMKTKR